MKIAFICGFAWEPKGTVRARGFPLALELARLGHDVRLFIAPYDNPADSGRDFEREGVRITNLKVAGLWGNVATLPFRLVIKALAWQADIIHVLKPKGIAGVAAHLLLCRGVPIVLDCDDWEGWGGWNEVKNYSHLTKSFIDWQERSLMRSAKVLTVASRVLQNRATEVRGRDEDVFYLPNGTSEKMLAVSDALRQVGLVELKQSVGLPDIPIVLYVGHFDPLDDVMFFAKGTAAVLSRLNAMLAIVGDGPELWRVKEFFDERKSTRVKFFGRLSRDQYARVVAASDIATFPYPDNGVYRAKCSARIIDFMAAAKPILTSAVGQNPEYIVHGRTGLLTQAGDENGYRAALENLLLDTNLRERLGLAARQSLETFLWSRNSTHACLQAYRRALGRDTHPEAMATV